MLHQNVISQRRRNIEKVRDRENAAWVGGHACLVLLVPLILVESCLSLDHWSFMLLLESTIVLLGGGGMLLLELARRWHEEDLRATRRLLESEGRI